MSVQNLRVGRGSNLVAKSRDSDRFLQIGNGLLLANSHFVELFVPDQRVGDVTERTLDCLSVDDESLVSINHGSGPLLLIEIVRGLLVGDFL